MSYVGKARNIIDSAARHLRLSPPRTPEKPGGKKVVAMPIPGSLVPEPIHDTVVSEFVPPTFIPNKDDTVVDINLQRSLEVGARTGEYIPKPYAPNLGNLLPAPGSDTGKPQIGLTNLTGTEVIVNDHTYEIGELIGRGGEGIVYHAVQKSTGKEVVIKFSRGAGTSIVKEAEALAKIGIGQNPYIVQYVEHDDRCLVMERIKGVTLERHLRKRGPLPLCDALSFALQVCDALAFASGKGVVHRDLKPSNIMIDGTTGSARVIDWSIGANYDELQEGGDVAGSLAYCDPRQLEGNKDGTCSDVYSFAIVLMEMLIGTSPVEHMMEWRSTILSSMGEADQDDALAYLSIHRGLRLQEHPSVPQPLLGALRKMTRQRERERYPNWTRVTSALNRAARRASSQPISA